MLVRVGADVSQLKKGMREAQNSVAYFGRSVADSMGAVKKSMLSAFAVGGTGFVFVQGAQDAMQYEALMTTLGESLGKSIKTFEEWQSTTGSAMGFSMLQGAKLANMLSLNFKSIATSQEDLTNRTTKMMEVAGVIANKRGMTMQEVSDRIRSAMNGEADGADELGVNVRIAAMKMSDAYQQMADGQPWDQLTDNQQKAIRYQHILDEVSRNLGMTMQDTTATRMATFTATLANVRLALGQAFLPILYVVLPILNRLAQALYRVLQVVGAFMRSLFGGFATGAKKTNNAIAGGIAPIKEQTGAIKDLGSAQDSTGKKTEKAGKKAKKAGKEAKRGVASFDEINQLTDPATGGAGAGGAGAGGGGIGGGGGAGGLGDLGGLEMPSMGLDAWEDSLAGMADKFKKYTDPIRKVAKQVWSAISGFAIQKFNEISKWWSKNGAQISEGFKNAWSIVKPVIKFVVGFVWESIKGLVSGVITFFQGLIEFFTGVFTGDWAMVWEGTKKIFIGAFQAIWNFTNLTFIGGLKKGFIALFTSSTKLIKGFTDDAIKYFKNFWTNLGKILSTIKTNFRSMVNSLRDWWIDLCFKLALKWVEFSTKVKSIAGQAVQGFKDAFKGVLDWFGRSIVTPLINKFQEIRNAFKGGLEQGLKSVVNSIRAPLNNMIDGFNAVKNQIPLAKHLPNVPRIPALAQGGIVTSATLAMIGEGRQDEAVAPLDKLQGFITNAVMNAGGGGSGDVILNIDGRTFARLIRPHLERENERVGKNVRLKPI